MTDVVALPVFANVFVFLAWDAHYSHPAAQFSRRAELLELLSDESDAEVFAVALAHNRYDRVDHVVFRASGAAGTATSTSTTTSRTDSRL